ncbi:MAG: hypothetical protein P4L73_19320 [Caulobacteraceae bacterium]|nr:hypothetical protein [Caulobacteraceae bacterium]
MLPFPGMPFFQGWGPCTWNPSRIYSVGPSPTTLDATKLIATVPGGAQAALIGTLPRGAGKYYFEVETTGAAGAGNNNVGLSPRMEASFNQFGTSGYGVIMDAYTGRLHDDDTFGNISYGTSLNISAILSVAVDLTNSLIWMAQDGVWVGSPGVSGGESILAGRYYPVWQGTAGSGLIPRGRFKTADFYHAAPSGFLPWGH